MPTIKNGVFYENGSLNGIDAIKLKPQQKVGEILERMRSTQKVQTPISETVIRSMANLYIDKYIHVCEVFNAPQVEYWKRCKEYLNSL